MFETVFLELVRNIITRERNQQKRCPGCVAVKGKTPYFKTKGKPVLWHDQDEKHARQKDILCNLKHPFSLCIERPAADLPIHVRSQPGRATPEQTRA